jgi:lipoate-protein ligase A
MTTLEAALAHRPHFDDVAAALRESFEKEHGVVLQPGGLSSEETAQAEALVRDKYATDAWLAGPA